MRRARRCSSPPTPSALSARWTAPLFNDEVDFDKDWLEDARRYYGNIVGKYGPQVQAALKKLSGLDIATICPLHGPVWRNDLGYLLNKYDLWSRYEPEEKAVAIFYASMYGNTENAANLLANGSGGGGREEHRPVRHLQHPRLHPHRGDLPGATTSCWPPPPANNGMYPAMANLIHDMKSPAAAETALVGLIENGTWNPASG